MDKLPCTKSPEKFISHYIYAYDVAEFHQEDLH